MSHSAVLHSVSSFALAIAVAFAAGCSSPSADEDTEGSSAAATIGLPTPEETLESQGPIVEAAFRGRWLTVHPEIAFDVRTSEGTPTVADPWGTRCVIARYNADPDRERRLPKETKLRFGRFLKQEKPAHMRTRNYDFALEEPGGLTSDVFLRCNVWEFWPERVAPAILRALDETDDLTFAAAASGD